MLKFYPSNRTENLAFIIAEIMRREPLKKIFDQEKVIIQSFGMGTWLQQQISEELGISAMVECSMPASFIWKLAEALLPKPLQVQGFEKQNLRWQLFEQLPSKLAQPEYQRLRRYAKSLSPNTDEGSAEPALGNAGDEALSQSLVFDMASVIADVFDGYQNYRPEWLQAWEQGKPIKSLASGLDSKDYSSPQFTELEAWQADLWCSVYPDLPLAQRQHRSSLLTRLESCIRALPKGAELQLPERIFVFGLSALPPRMLAVIKALAEHIDIHVVVNNPCRYYWGDVMSEYQQLLLNQSLLARGVSAETVAENFIEHNALLASWGKLGRDYMSLLMQEEIFADLATELYDDLGDEDNSALNLIQSDILNLQNQHHCVNPDDKSIRFASCHNHLREVEALHDYLLNTLDANPGLNARDIIVMVPDIEDYAAYIEAVFSRLVYDRHGQTHSLPYVIADQALNRHQPLLECIGNLLILESSRMTAAELLDCLDFPAIRQRFSIDEDELLSIHHWVKVLNVRWGLSETHRNKILNIEDAGGETTWLAALKRLLSAYILGPVPVASFAGEQVIPEEVFGSDQQVLVGKFVRFIDVVEQTLSMQAGEKHPLDALATIADVWRLWLDQDTLHESVTQAMAKALEALSDEFRVTGYEKALPFSIVAQQVKQVLEEEQVSQRFLSGRINFCTLMPMRSVPFSLVCLLGLNEGKYPRPENKPSFDLMARSPGRVGDRSRRDDDRYLFLEALLSARNYLYISYTGRNISDNSIRYPSVLVSELQDYCRTYFKIENEADADVVELWTKQHRLQAFHSDYYSEKVSESHSEKILDKSYNMDWMTLFSPKQEDLSRGLELESREEDETNANVLEIDAPPLHQFDMFAEPQSDQLVEDDETEIQIQSLSLEELLSALSSPLKYYYQKILGLKVSKLPDDLEESEAFALDRLDIYALKGDILRTVVKDMHKEVDSDTLTQACFDQWRLSGRLPKAPLDETYFAQAKDELVDLSTYIERALAKEASTLVIDFQLSGKRIVGSLVLLDSAVCEFSLSRSSPALFFSSWVKHVVVNYLFHHQVAPGHETGLELKTESRLINAEQVTIFPELSAADAKSYMEGLLELFTLTGQEALPFLPKTAFSWIFEGESKARKIFEGNKQGYNAREGEMDDPYWQRYCLYTDHAEVRVLPDIESQRLVKQVAAYKEEFIFTDLQGEVLK